MSRRVRGAAARRARALLAASVLAVLAACSSSGSTTQQPDPDYTPTVRVHYYRADGAYAGWAVYAWEGPTNPSNANGNSWPGDPRYTFDTADADGWGMYTDIPVDVATGHLAWLLNRVSGTDVSKQNCAASVTVDGVAAPTSEGNEPVIPFAGTLAARRMDLWVQEDCSVATTGAPLKRPNPRQAVWLTPDTLVWPSAPDDMTYALYTAAEGGMTVAADGSVSGGQAHPLSLGTLPADLRDRFPQYATARTLTLAGLSADEVKALLRGELLAYGENASFRVSRPVQIAPVLDELYAAAASPQALGVTFTGGQPVFKVWAPTARAVQLKVYASATAAVGSPSTTAAMTLDPASGVWSYTGQAGWVNQSFYLYDVEVFAAGAVQRYDVTDPYAASLNANGTLTAVVDLASAAAQPAGWATHPLLPTAAAPTDAVVYELHVRDFSMNDDTVTSAAEKGKYLGFTHAGSKGLTHLAALQAAGVTHVHLLPVFDLSSVDEGGCVENPTIPETTGDALGASTATLAARDTDCYNWGYDPFHYGAPEGSYASAPADPLARVEEFRAMVQALHGMGLRVVMDVVYNHTPESGAGAHSVLDKIVPGYYHRLDPGTGGVQGASCCSDTATEFAMMEKLMTDTLVTWASAYKVDGFRFDLMGFHPVAAMTRARAAVEAAIQGDGRGHTYFYGEGWSENVPFVNADQAHVAGTGIGAFNDRLRDAVRGGSAFTSGADMPTSQGFASGLCYDNHDGSACSDAQRAAILNAQDLISVSLAGNLADFALRPGTTGADVDYRGARGGYTQDPAENIAYVSAHDNETIWDLAQYRHPAGVSSQDRVRAHVVALSIPLLSQGVAFLHGGDDLLRSKSMDSDSFNSGDYFNRIFWDGAGNNWAVGAPPQGVRNNTTNLPQLSEAFANPNTQVTQAQILGASARVQEFLRIRKDTTMFQLKTGAQVKSCVSFPDQVQGQQPGLVVMQIGDGGTTHCGDDKYARVVVLFNANRSHLTFTEPALVGKVLSLHPVQATGGDVTVGNAQFDGATGTFDVPARSTAVFVEPAP